MANAPKVYRRTKTGNCGGSEEQGEIRGRLRAPLSGKQGHDFSGYRRNAARGAGEGSVSEAAFARFNSSAQDIW